MEKPHLKLIETTPSNYYIDELSQQAIGTLYGISISTAIALEAITVENAKSYNINLKDCNRIFINLRTHFRNFIGSFPSDASIRTKINRLADLYLTELVTIKGLIELNHPHLSLVYYLPSYKSLAFCLPNAKIKTVFTKKQQDAINLEERVFRALKLNNADLPIIYTDCRIPGDNASAIIITHMPIDLLSSDKFRKLYLLESHTGKFRSNPEFISKLNRSDAYKNLPFNILTFQLLGDGSNLLNSMGSSIINPIMELAVQRKWSAITNFEKIKSDIRNIKDRASRDYYLSLCNSYLK